LLTENDVDLTVFEGDAAASAPTPPATPSVGYHTDGNPGTGTPASLPGAYYFHQIATELQAVVTAGGIAPDPADLGQLLSALRRIAIPVGMVEFHGSQTLPPFRLEARGDHTIGAAGSGATHAAADYADLFALLWTDWPASMCPIFTSGGGATVRGASAAADWADGKRIQLPELRGEFLRGWDNGRGVDGGRSFGTTQSDALGAPITTTGKAPSRIMVSAERTSAYPITDAVDGIDSGAGFGDSGATSVTRADVTFGDETRPRNVAVLVTITY
jgi:hypothetical protein